MKTAIQAVIFDLDGVLVDTEPLVIQAWQQILTPYGCPLSEEDILYIMGIDEETTNRYILHKTGLPLDLETATRIHRQHLSELFRRELRPVPGAAELLAALTRRGLALAVASNSRAEYVTEVLEDIGLRGWFRALATRELAAQGKPAPDLYLAAARLLDVAPQACLAVEDSPAGLQAAVQAGMQCLVTTPPELPQESFAAARARYDSLAALAKDIDCYLT